MTSSQANDAAAAPEESDGPGQVSTPADDVPKDSPGQQPSMTRRRVLDAAEELFLEGAPVTTPLATIAARAGVSKAVLLEHFESRTQLMAELAGRLYLRGFPFDADPLRRDLRGFMRAYLDIQHRPEVRLIWVLGAQIAADRPGGPDAAYWHLVGEVELRLAGAGLETAVSHERSLVLTPALMLMADRAARDLTTPEEIDDFLAAASKLGLGD